MARVLAVVPDLMLGSRVVETLTGAGHEVELVAAPPSGGDPGVELVVADLMAADPGGLVSLGPPVLGFYAHTEPQVRERALEAGVAMAVPRSRMARELPELVSALLDVPQR